MNDIKLSELETFYSEAYASGMEAGLKIGYALAKSEFQYKPLSFSEKRMPVTVHPSQHLRRRRSDLSSREGAS